MSKSVDTDSGYSLHDTSELSTSGPWPVTQHQSNSRLIRFCSSRTRKHLVSSHVAKSSPHTYVNRDSLSRQATQQPCVYLFVPAVFDGPFCSTDLTQSSRSFLASYRRNQTLALLTDTGIDSLSYDRFHLNDVVDLSRNPVDPLNFVSRPWLTQTETFVYIEDLLISGSRISSDLSTLRPASPLSVSPSRCPAS